MKKIISIILIIVFLFPSICYADEEESDEIDGIYQIWEEVKPTLAKKDDEPKLNSRACIVLDRRTKTILFGKNENEKRAMASTTKIMTSILVLERGNLEEVVEVSRESCRNRRIKTRIKKRR